LFHLSTAAGSGEFRMTSRRRMMIGNRRNSIDRRAETEG
jgi:hypothetical protein